MPVQIQTLDARYIDGAKLVKLLKDKFGEGNFAFDVCVRTLAMVLPLMCWFMNSMWMTRIR